MYRGPTSRLAFEIRLAYQECVQAVDVAAPPRGRLDDGSPAPDVIVVIEPQAPTALGTLTLIARLRAVRSSPLVQLPLRHLSLKL